MKKTIAILAAICSLNFVMAQDHLTAAPGTNQTQKPKPEMIAARHSKHLQKMLTLTEEQTQKVNDALVIRFTEAQAIKEKAGANADKKTIHEQLKPVRQKFVQTMNTILTPEQKTKWEEHRLQIKKNRAMHKDAKGTPATDGGNGDMKKLTDDEDGMED
ncbi:MAG TPA: hypothetical protein VNZ49_06675 [Bacteroidia bacterium]|jgi:Spy/CpxP family protein refolding chaperone|nr:hypothetical protein [Bacteroidia bacterium]